MKLCESCRYRNSTEYEKPCIVYRDDCEFYEKERGDMTDDLISRQAVQDYIAKYLSQYLYEDVRQAVEVIDEFIGGLPSVNPQEPKTGHWIRMKTYEKWGCSECNTVFRFTFKEHDYCPNCGCRMVEPQESEDKG